MNWTDEEAKMLTKLYKEGISLAKIVKHFGRGKNAIIGKLHRLKLYRKKRRKATLAPKTKPEPQFRPKPVGREPLVGNKYDPPLMVERKDGVEFFDLKPQDCRWAFGESNYWFCGRRRIENSSYCQYHHNRARTGP